VARRVPVRRSPHNSMGTDRVSSCIEMNARQAHEHHWIVPVVFRRVVDIGFGGHQQCAMVEVDPNGERARLGRLVNRQTREQLPAMLEGRRPVGRALLDVWKGQTDSLVQCRT